MGQGNNREFAIVVLAAGQGKRMNNPDMSKVMALLAGKPLISHVLDQAKKTNPAKIVLIVGHQKQSVIDFVNANYNNIEFTEQKQQLGTGHAVAQTERVLEDFKGDVLILSGDVPLLKSETLDRFILNHNETRSDISVLSTITDSPQGYGRIVRDAEGNFLRIVEEKDADESQKGIKEINSGIYFADSRLLFESLSHVSNNNAQGEYYLTDIIEILYNQGKKVNCLPGADIKELQGINSPDDLALAEKYYRERI